MSPITATEEDYLKAIYKFSSTSEQVSVSTNKLAAELKTAPASVTDMIKRLSEKRFIQYTPYRGVALTEDGLKLALQIIRKQRLWEVFLVEKLKFTWDEVHETAEQLEHIRSQKLIAKLDEFLGFPRFDPHGDPIPDENGKIIVRNTNLLAAVEPGTMVRVAAVLQHSPEFLQYLNRLHLNINTVVKVLELIPYDESLVLEIEDQELIVSKSVTQNVLVVLEED